MMTFRLHLQRMKSQGNKRMRFSLEKPKDSNIADIFRATIGGKFAPLLVLGNQDTEIDTLINRCNTVTETANDILGKHRPTKKHWVKDDILKLCEKRRYDDDNDGEDNDYDGGDNEEEEEEEDDDEDNDNDDNNHSLM